MIILDAGEVAGRNGTALALKVWKFGSTWSRSEPRTSHYTVALHPIHLLGSSSQEDKFMPEQSWQPWDDIADSAFSAETDLES